MAARMITVTVFNQEEYESNWPPSGLAQAIAWFQRMETSIPAEYRHTAELKIESVSSWDDSHYASISITYTRPKTKE